MKTGIIYVSSDEESPIYLQKNIAQCISYAMYKEIQIVGIFTEDINISNRENLKQALAKILLDEVDYFLVEDSFVTDEWIFTVSEMLAPNCKLLTLSDILSKEDFREYYSEIAKEMNLPSRL